jgi:hypothetical protein
MAAGWTLATIRQKVRALTATSADALTDPQVNDYINNYYVYTMPFELKNQIQIQYLTFTTVAGQDIYPVDPNGVFPANGKTEYLTNMTDAYADGLKMVYYQSPEIFFQDWPQIYNTDSLSGNGGVNYISAVTGPPIIKGTLVVADANGIQVAQDNGAGQFIGNVTPSPSGSINYATGAYTVNFTNAITTGTPMVAKYQNFVATRPQAILYFTNTNNQFTYTLRPIPDTVYVILLEGFISPKPLEAPNPGPATPPPADALKPTLEEWGQCLAYGAAFDIFMDRGDQVAAENIWNVLKRFETVALGRTLQQYLNMRSRPRF